MKNAHALFRTLAGLTLASLIAINLASAQPVSDRVLSRIRVNETEECAVVTIDFNFTVQAEAHFPEDHGDHVRIDLRPIEVGRVNGAVNSREELRPPSSRRAGIQEIQYDGDAPTGPTLTVTFVGERYFRIEQGGDFRSVVMKISDSPVDETCSRAKPSLRGGPDAGPEQDRTASASVLHKAPETLDVNAVYALNLLSQQQPVTASKIAAAAPLDRYAAYSVRFERDGVIWHRLRLGFFATRAEAQQVKDELVAFYPDAWIVRAGEEERQSVYRAWLSARSAGARNLDLVPQSPPIEALPENADAAALVAEARAKIAAGDNARAIQLLTKATALEESKASPEARELLGIAREKNGQLAHAKAEYEEYLKRYPDGEGAARVRQRLSALLTAGKEAPPALREGKPVGDWVSRLSASLSQYYQRDESIVTLEQPNIVPDPDRQVNQNALISGADITASVSNDRFDANMRFSGAHTKDFSGDDNSYGSISALFFELADNVSRFAARVGRQTRSTGGVLGRFDGGLLSFDASDEVRVNVVGGVPVVRSRDLFIDEHRRFVGGSVDVNQVVKGLDATAYYIRQTVDDLIDREAAGLELRYTDERLSAYGLVDYDVIYDTLNLALFNSTLRLKDDTTINASFDYRYAPTLMTIDAFQGQGVETIDELRAQFGFTDEDIYYLAEERAARMKSGSFTVTHPFSPKLQVNAGVTLTSTEATIDAGGVPGQPGTGVEAYYLGQILATNLFADGDLVSLGFRFDDMASARRYVIDVNTRYPITNKFRINPRLRMARRDSTVAEQTQYTLKPSIRLNYIPSRRFQLELEAGGEWTQTDNLLDTETVKGYYVIGGYRLDF
ncbi:MAG: SPOR domain-containing protein [Pseudomonadota bacterium]